MCSFEGAWKALAGGMEACHEQNASEEKQSSIAQSVEHAAVNRGVVGSSPTGGV